jgi:NADH-ubiquinone oxidoreductase chain 5
MEGPTPVSSLLHSSTIVVAGVYLMILIPNFVPVMIVVVLLALNIVRQMDVKKNIAYSTSIHLALIVLLSVSRMYSIVVTYILLHRIVKGQLFQSSRYEIHGVGIQDIRKFKIGSSTLIILGAMFMLSAIVGIVMIRSKEYVVLGIMSLVIILLIVVSMIYTVRYMGKLSVVVIYRESERMYVLILIIVSIIVLQVNFIL